MTMVVGYAPDGRARAVLHLATMLARSGGQDLVLCAVVPLPWPASPARVDAEYRAVVGHGESWDEALEDVEWEEGDVLVVGSSKIGPIARVFLGSRASKIVRHSPVPVVVVPRGRAAEVAEDAVRAESA